MSNDGYFQFGIGTGDKSMRHQNTRFKADGGKKYRASFAWWGEDEEGNIDWESPPQFSGCSRYYVQGKGYFVHRGPEYQKFFGKEPRKAGATVMVFWPCNKDGRVLKEEMRDGNYEVLNFVFDSSKYEAFWPFHEEFGFHNMDLLISCTDAQYQKMTFSPKKGNLLRQLMESPDGADHVKKILEGVAERRMSIQNDLGRALPLSEIQRLMGGKRSSGNVSTPDASAGEEVDDVLANILDD